MSDLFSSIVEEEKELKKVKFIHKIFPYIIFTTIIMALIIGGYNFYKINDQSKKESSAKSLIKEAAGYVSNLHNQEQLEDFLASDYYKNLYHNQSDFIIINITKYYAKSDILTPSVFKILYKNAKKDLTKSYIDLIFFDYMLNLEDEYFKIDSKLKDTKSYLDIFNKIVSRVSMNKKGISTRRHKLVIALIYKRYGFIKNAMEQINLLDDDENTKSSHLQFLSQYISHLKNQLAQELKNK